MTGALACALGWAAAMALAGAHWRVQRRLVLVARASHELRGPLCAARLGVEALARSGHAARVAAIDLELRRAALALDDLAAARRGRRGRERRGDVDMAALVRESATSWRAVAARHGARLVVEVGSVPLRVHGDRLRIAQACANLVANAAEHGGGVVRVRARAVAGRVRVEVADDGPGLPAPVPVLVASARGRLSRRGHGLAIAAAIAERHGGAVTTGPSPIGARVVLELPSLEAPAPSVARRRPRRLRRRREPTWMPAA